jgi:hypothetical protein
MPTHRRRVGAAHELKPNKAKAEESSSFLKKRTKKLLFLTHLPPPSTNPLSRLRGEGPDPKGWEGEGSQPGTSHPQ